jgi:hypothetical protein
MCMCNGISPIWLAARCSRGSRGSLLKRVTWLAAQEGHVARCSRGSQGHDKGHDKCLGELIKEGGDVNKCGGDEGCSPIFNAAKNGHASCLSQLVAAGGDASVRCSHGTSPLDIARKTSP